MQVRTQRRILQRLQIVIHGRLAIVAAVGHVLQAQLNLLYRHDVADVLRHLQVTKGTTNDLVVDYGRPAAVSRINRGIDLDAQPERRKTVPGKFNPRDNSFGNGKTRPASGIAVNHDRVLGVRERLSKRQRRVRIEKVLVFQFENSEIDPRSDSFDNSWEFVAGLVGLDLHFAGIVHNMRICQNALAADYDPTGGDIVRLFFCPRFGGIGLTEGGEDFHDRVFDRLRRSDRGG